MNAAVHVDDITDRPWTGRCATTGWTMSQFGDALAGLRCSNSIKRAAVAIVRAYPSKIGANNVAKVATFIEGAEVGLLRPSAKARARSYRKPYLDRLEDEPQYPEVSRPWMDAAAAMLVEEFDLRGSSDPGYVRNTIAGEHLPWHDTRRHR